MPPAVALSGAPPARFGARREPPPRPRRPEQTVLYRLVQQHVPTFFATFDGAHDRPLPRYVREEVRRYLDGGIFADERRWSASADGFDVHAGVRIADGDDEGRERLARYLARPPLSLERLSLRFLADALAGASGPGFAAQLGPTSAFRSSLEAHEALAPYPARPLGPVDPSPRAGTATIPPTISSPPFPAPPPIPPVPAAPPPDPAAARSAGSRRALTVGRRLVPAAARRDGGQRNRDACPEDGSPQHRHLPS